MNTSTLITLALCLSSTVLLASARPRRGSSILNYRRYPWQPVVPIPGAKTKNGIPIGNGNNNGNCFEGFCDNRNDGSDNGNNNLGFKNGGNGNNNGNCLGGICVDTVNGNGNGNENIKTDQRFASFNGNNNGNCKGNCVDTFLGNGNGNHNVDGINGNNAGNCIGNCEGAVAGNFNGNFNTDGGVHGNNVGNCVGNCEDFVGGNGLNANNVENCFGNCSPTNPGHRYGGRPHPKVQGLVNQGKKPSQTSYYF